MTFTQTNYSPRDNRINQENSENQFKEYTCRFKKERFNTRPNHEPIKKVKKFQISSEVTVYDKEQADQST